MSQGDGAGLDRIETELAGIGKNLEELVEVLKGIAQTLATEERKR